MFEVMIVAERECTESRDISPDKVLRPIGTEFKEWTDAKDTTDLPHWINWRVKDYCETYMGRSGDVLLYERNESLELI